MTEDTPLQSILLATSNLGKFREIVAEFADVSVRLISLKDISPIQECVEDGATFEANAIKKARHFAAASGLMTLADDSGLEVDALDGAPGIISARYAGEPCDDDANNAKLVRQLAGVPDGKRQARFRCAMALVDSDGQVLITTDGVIEGRIIDVPRGKNGFGYDPHFLVVSLGKTTAELSGEEKNSISHRGQATRAMKAALAGGSDCCSTHSKPRQ